MKAWHFLPESGRLANGDKRQVRVGRWLVHRGDLSMCERGLHASKRAIDALRHAPGPVVCRVEVGGEIIEGGGKLVCTRRKILWRYDASKVLRKFARLCALDVTHLWDPPDVVLRWLRTGDESIRDAAGDAARTAARAAARDAAGDAARDAARDAAWATAWAAARDAAWAAAWATQNKRLVRMLRKARR